MKKKEIKGYLAFSVSLMVILSACGTKTPAPTPIPTKAPIQSIDPGDLDIPGITDDTPVDPGTTTDPGTVDPGTTTDPGTVDPGTTTPDPTATTDPGTVTPTATATVDPTATTDPGTVTPTATATAPAVVTCEAKITGDLNGLSGSIVQLTAKNECSDGKTAADTFSWSSSDTTIATVDSSGKVSGIKAGNINLTATSNLNSAIKTSVQFKVNSTCSISLSGDLVTTPFVGLSSSKQLNGKVACNDGVESTTNISWSSSDSSVASVNTSGLVEGKKKGTAKITATYRTDNSVTTSLDITVNDPNGNETKAKISENKLYLPSGIDVRNGKIYVTHIDDGTVYDDGRVKVLDLSGNQTSEIKGSFGDSLPTGLTGVVSDGSRVWVTNKARANQSANNIYSFDIAGGTRKNAGIGLSSGTDLRDMAIDPTTKSLYVANGLGYVMKVNYDASGTVDAAAQQLYFVNNVNPSGIAVDDLGNLFVVNIATNPATVIKYNKDGTESLRFNSKGKTATGPNNVTSVGDIAYDPKNGGIIYVLASLDNGKTVILRYDASGNFVRYFGEDAGMINPMAMAIGADGTIYVADWGVVSSNIKGTKGIIHQFGPGK